MFVSHWMAADFDALIKSGAWPQFDPTRTVLLEGAPAGMEPIDAGRAQQAPSAQVSIARYDNTVVELEVIAERAGFVLLNDVWHPWWRASVDDTEAEILKANVLFRAVQVPPGRHTVRFEFEPITGAIAEITQAVRGGH
jgi:hypothetical protein